MPPSEIIAYRLKLIEGELNKALSEYPGESVLDRMKFIRGMVRLVKSQIELDDDPTFPVLDVELDPPQEYPRR